jgi:DNA polymerase-1
MLFIDTEITTWSKGSPWDERNFLVCIGWIDDTGAQGIWYNGEPREVLEHHLSLSELWVFFNAKFDLHWLRKIGIKFPQRSYCCQVAEFVLNGQSPKYPSLDGTAASYGIPGKLDVVKLEYWDKGINTHEIPRGVLTEYCLQDIASTRDVYYKQQERIQPSNKTLLSLEMQDLVVLEDIEWNGMKFSPEKVKAKEQELEKQISELQQSLDVYHNVPNFNWGSPAHLSALLYGGTIQEVRKVAAGTFKSGAKVGAPKFKNETVTHTLPRMYTPPKGSELAKPGVWSVDEDTLLSIKGGKKELIERILKVKELAKLQSTYVTGLLKKHEEQHQPAGYIHGQYNQVVASTGRLSSSNPNMQNMSEAVLDIFETRF